MEETFSLMVRMKAIDDHRDTAKKVLRGKDYSAGAVELQKDMLTGGAVSANVVVLSKPKVCTTLKMLDRIRHMR